MLGSELEEYYLSYHFFFFVNTKSGNRQGQQIMSYKAINFDTHFGGRNKVNLTFVDLFDNDNRISQINNLQNAISLDKKLVRIIVCGGDGTISWVLNELVKTDLDFNRCAFGVLPIGTGNDFCRTIGWPSENFDFGLQNFLEQIKRWINASLSKYDIWDVSIDTYKNGKIYDIKDCKEYQRSQTSIKKVFSNYVGMGLDARVVYTVQKIRTPYAFINKILYGLVGCLNFFRPMKELKKKLLSFNQQSLEMGPLIKGENTTEGWLQDQLKSTKTVTSVGNSTNLHTIKKKYRGFVCLNASSYMAGLRNVWETSRVCTSQAQDRFFTAQTHNDGKVQFVAYKNQLGLALERCLRSGARITQGSGPFEILLKQPTEQETTHMQIDGESIKIENLRSIKISRTDRIEGHQINIMISSAQ